MEPCKTGLELYTWGYGGQVPSFSKAILPIRLNKVEKGHSLSTKGLGPEPHLIVSSPLFVAGTATEHREYH